MQQATKLADLKRGGLVLGQTKDGHCIYYTPEDTHSLILGATRCGKTRCLVEPSIALTALAGESMGLVSGETAAFTYGPPTRSAAISLFQLLGQTPYDYVIVDCDSNPLYDQTTLAALEYAQLGLMPLTPDTKGYEFRKAQLGWLGNSDVFHEMLLMVEKIQGKRK